MSGIATARTTTMQRLFGHLFSNSTSDDDPSATTKNGIKRKRPWGETTDNHLDVDPNTTTKDPVLDEFEENASASIEALPTVTNATKETTTADTVPSIRDGKEETFEDTNTVSDNGKDDLKESSAKYLNFRPLESSVEPSEFFDNSSTTTPRTGQHYGGKSPWKSSVARRETITVPEFPTINDFLRKPNIRNEIHSERHDDNGYYPDDRKLPAQVTASSPTTLHQDAHPDTAAAAGSITTISQCDGTTIPDRSDIATESTAVVYESAYYSKNDSSSVSQPNTKRDLFHILTFTSARIGNFKNMQLWDDSAWCFPSSNKKDNPKTDQNDDNLDWWAFYYHEDDDATTPTLPGTLSKDQIQEMANVPEKGTFQHYIYEQRFLKKTIVSDQLPPLPNRADSSLLVFHRWIQSRIAAGWIRSTLSKVHFHLQQTYHQAKKIASKAWKNQQGNGSPKQPDTLWTLRHRLAGLWCIYAHVIVEIGLEAYSAQQKQRQQKQQEETRRKTYKTVLDDENGKDDDDDDDGDNDESTIRQTRTKSVASALTTLDNDSGKEIAHVKQEDVIYHAIAILQTAQCCPLVGNHKYVALALGRMSFVGCGLIYGDGCSRVFQAEQTTTRMKSQRLLSVIQDASSNCWDVMESCHGSFDGPHKRDQMTSPEELAEDSIASLPYYEPCRDMRKHRKRISSTGTPKRDEHRISAETIREEMKIVLTLPEQFKDDLHITNKTIVCDRNAARSICYEVNRWSRLKERLEQRQITTLIPRVFYDRQQQESAGATPWLDHLVLFRTMDCPSDIPPSNSKWTDLEHAMPMGKGVAQVEWHW